MWKRIGIIFVTLFLSCSIVYTMKQELNAAALGDPDPQYLPEGTTFMMGDLKWKVADNNQDGTGIIVSHTYGPAGYSTAKANLPVYYNYNGASSSIGDKVKEMNNVNSVSLLKLSEYKSLTNNLTNFDRVDKLVDRARSSAFWIDDEGNYNSGYFYYKADSYPPYTQEMKNLWKGAGLATVPGFPVFIINLPIQPIQTPTFIQGVMDDALVYDNPAIDADQHIGVITFIGGEGPFTYRVESGTSNSGDLTIDNEAIPAGTEFSTDFKLHPSNNRDIELRTNKKLNAGDHYVKIKITDTSTNSEIAYDLSDPKHAEKTIILKFHVEKKEQTIAHSSEFPIYIKIGNAPVTSTITSNNTDDSFVAGKVTYALSGGTPNTGLTITPSETDPLEYSISVGATYAGNSLPATFHIEANAAATDNFKAAKTDPTREIIVYKELSDLTWTCDKPSGFATTDVDTPGAHIGTLQAVNGISPYVYEFTSAVDGSKYDSTAAANNKDFEIKPSSQEGIVDVVARTALPADTYYVQFKVNDTSDDSIVIYKSVQIKVSAKAQAALHFKTGAGGTILDAIGKEIYIDDTDAMLFAEGGTTNKPIKYSLVDPSDATYLSVGSGGSLSPQKVGKVRVKATMDGDTQYDAVSVEMEVTILPGRQSIAFSDPADKNVMIDSAKFVNPAVAKKVVGNTPGVGTITYTSSNPNVASVDPSTGEVTPGSTAGTTTIMATIHDTDGNYADASCTKKVTTFSGMTTTWSPTTPKAKAEAITAGTTVAGKLSVTGNNGNPTFTIERAVDDGDLFTLTSVGTSTQIIWNTTVSASAYVAHGETYKVRIKIEDNNHAPQYEDIEILIDPADNGIDFMDGSTRITSITKTYGEDTTFTIQAISKNGGVITYALDSGAPSDVITLSGTNMDTAAIQKVGTTTIKASVSAGSGYSATDATIPVTITKGSQKITFDDTTANMVYENGKTFSASATLYETSADAVSIRLLQYASKTPAICSVDAAGTVTMLAEGNCTIEASNKDANFTETTNTRTINLYTGLGVTFTQTDIPQAETTSGQVNSAVGELSVNGGDGSYTYAKETGNDSANADASFFKISATGIISLDEQIDAADIASKYDADKEAYILHVQFKVTDGLDNSKTINCDVEIQGAPLNAAFDTDGLGKISHVYAPSPGNTFSVNLENNAGNGVPRYRYKGGPTDVITIDASGRITILNASIVQDPLVEIEAVIPPSRGYDQETITGFVEITKAEQTNFKFQMHTIQMQTNTSIDPILTGIASKQDDGSYHTYTLSSMNASLVSANGTTITSGGSEVSAPGVEIKAMVPGDRNYKSAIASAFVIISDAPAYNFAISVPSATYGDTNVQASVPLDDGIGTKTRVWTSSDPTVATIDNDGNITILKAGTTTITCEQSTPTQPTVRDSGVLAVAKRAITLQADDKQMYIGEALPSFTYQLSLGTLVGDDPLPIMTMHTPDLPTPPIADTYAIEGTVDTSLYPNYQISILNGNLLVKQDESEHTWYHMEENATGNSITDTEAWYASSIDIVMDPVTKDTRVYDELSIDQTRWQDRITIDDEGELTNKVHFRAQATQALATPQQVMLRIDKTKPIIRSITGESANRDAVSEILHTLTFGKFFKPQLKVEIQAEDPVPEQVNKVSDLKSVDYKVYEILANGTLSETAVKEGSLKPKESFTLADEGMYMVCATATDHAGNTSSEMCSGIRIYTRGEDTNGDGIPDINIDIDGDGIPDINITEEGKKIPHLNIDTDGDGIPDYNIDVDGDGEPDVNIGPDISEWKPELCKDIDDDEELDFCTMEGLEPVLNIDTDKDGSPDINLDIDRDGKPELNVDTSGNRIPNINIDSNGDGKPDVNLAPNGDGVIVDKFADVTEWIPKKDVNLGSGKLKYDTMEGLVGKDNPSQLVDDPSGIVVTKPDGGTFLPNYAIKVDVVTDTVSEEEKQNIQKVLDDKSEIDEVFDVQLLKDNAKIQPDGSIKVRIPAQGHIDGEEGTLAVQQEDGSYKLVKAVYKNGFLEYETDYLGKVSLIKDKEEIKDPKPQTPATIDPETPKTSVKGTYTTTQGIGGAYTGDTSNSVLWIGLFIASLSILGIVIHRCKRTS